MSLSISTRYGSRANDPTLDYPTGSFKNKTAPDAADGTPLEKDWANDLLGARDAILAEAGILANGVADTAQASQLLAALQALGLRAATETQAGVLEIATAAEAQALLNDMHTLTPAKLAAAFGGANQGLTANGYQKLPGGLIIQWGVTGSVAPAASVTVTFPIAFPTLCASASAIRDVAGNAQRGDTASTFSVVSFVINNGSGETTCTFRWIAIGY